MTGHAASRSKAKRTARIAQAVAAALLAAGVVVGALGRGGDRGQAETDAIRAEGIEEEARALIASAEPGETDRDAGPAVDLSFVAGSLEAVGHVQPPEKPEPEEPEQRQDQEQEKAEDVEEAPQPEPESQPEPEAVTRYLGRVTAGNQTWGLFAVGERQAMMGVGAERSFPEAPPGERERLRGPSRGQQESTVTVSVLEIDEDTAIVEEAGRRFELEKASPDRQAISTASGQSGRSNDGQKQERDARRGRERPGERPTPDDFRDEDGDIDYDAYREAVRQWAEQRREAGRQT